MVCSCYNSRYCSWQTQSTLPRYLPYPVRRPFIAIKPLIGCNPLSVVAPIWDLTRVSRDVSEVPLGDVAAPVPADGASYKNLDMLVSLAREVAAS